MIKVKIMKNNAFNKIKLFSISVLLFMFLFLPNGNLILARQNFALDKINSSTRQNSTVNLQSALNQRKEILNKTANLTVKHLDNIKERVLTMPNLPLKIKAELSQKIDSRLKELDDEKVKIENLKSDDEIKDFSGKSLKKNKDIKKDISAEISNKIKEQQLLSLVVKIDKISKKFADNSRKMEKAGMDVLEIKRVIDSAKTTIEKIKEKINGGNYAEAAEMIKNLKKDFKSLFEN